MADVATEEGETLDALGEGRVRLFQRREGYRFNLDSMLLAGFGVERLDATRSLFVTELGTGCGVVALVVASWRPAWRVRGVEVQSGLAAIARRNSALNGLPVEIDGRDWRALPRSPPGEGADLVLCNPPWFEPQSGRTSDDAEKAAARHELHGGLGEAVAAAERILGPQGSVRFILPAARLVDVVRALEAVKLRAVRLRLVYPRPTDAAHALLIEADRSRRPLTIEAPLVLHDEAGGYSAEIRRLLGRAGP